MASTNKTKHIGLPQWEASDKPERSDFNTAFAAIDTSLAGISGTWIPELYAQSVKMNYIAGSNHAGNYFKLGNLVYIRFTLNISKLVTSTGRLEIHNLPFANTGGTSVVSVGYKKGLTNSDIVFEISKNEIRGGTTGTNGETAHYSALWLESSVDIVGSGIYLTNS